MLSQTIKVADLYLVLLSGANPASQMMTLVQLLPFVIGELVPEDDDHWHCFLLLKLMLLS